MTKERFKQLWKALVEDRPKKAKISTEDNLLPSNGVSPHLKEALLANSDENGKCLAMQVPKES